MISICSFPIVLGYWDDDTSVKKVVWNRTKPISVCCRCLLQQVTYSDRSSICYLVSERKEICSTVHNERITYAQAAEVFTHPLWHVCKERNTQTVDHSANIVRCLMTSYNMFRPIRTLLRITA